MDNLQSQIGHGVKMIRNLTLDSLMVMTAAVVVGIIGWVLTAGGHWLFYALMRLFN